jgi:hypothetical protein
MFAGFEGAILKVIGSGRRGPARGKRGKQRPRDDREA